MQTAYHITIGKIGCNQVKVAREVDEKTRELVWMFNLDDDDDPIVLKEFYAPTKFLIMNWEGWLRAYDVEIKEKVFERDFKSGLDCRARISRDGSKLYVSHNPERRQHTLTVLSLNDFSEKATHVLPDPIDLEYFRERKDGKLLYYYCGENHQAEEKGSEKWYHGFQVVAAETGASENFPMPNPPTDDFDRKGPVLDLERNIGAIPNWADIEFKMAADGKPRFIAKVDLFDLNTFQTIRTIPVREFKIEHLTTSESEDEETASILMAEERGEEYDEARNEFIQNLNTIRFMGNEDAMWLCWRAAAVRKVSLDGSEMSPILVAVKMPRMDDAKPFEYRRTHTHLGSIRDDHLVLHEHDDKLWLSLDGINLNSDQEIIPVELTNIPEDRQIKTIMPRGFKRQMEEMGKVVIKVDNLREDRSLLDALDRMVELCRDIAAIRQGNNLVFLVRDKKGKKQEDEQFFKEAIKVKGASEKIRQVIENFTEYPDAESLYIHEEATALCYAVYELAMSDPQYIDTALRYLAVMDFEHDVFCRETLIPGLIEKYGNSQHGPRLRVGIALIDDFEAPQIYLLNAFLDLDSTFRKWFDKGGSKEIPEILINMAKLGLKISGIQDIFDNGDDGLAALLAAFNSDAQD